MLRPIANAALITTFLCCSALAGTGDVGSAVINRPINDSSVGVIYLYLGPTQPMVGPGSIVQWSFFDNESNGKVTPLLYELTGANQWTVVAIGTTRTSNASGAQTHPFATIAGITSLQPTKMYTIGFTHRGYTGTGANIVADGGTAGVVDFDGYGVFSDRWAYAIGVAQIGTVLGSGGIALDPFGFGGRIYSASFSTDATLAGQTPYCTAGTSTNGCVPSISSTGAPSAAATSGFTIRVTGVEGAKIGLLFYGVSGRAISTWGASSSFLCVKAPTQRMAAIDSGGTAGQCNGVLSTDWLAYLASTPSALGEPFAAGATVDAQAWYRDPPSPKTTNLSNALEFVTVP
jgi:hypothetical protein